jgi:hypothetical protein
LGEEIKSDLGQVANGFSEFDEKFVHSLNVQDKGKGCMEDVFYAQADDCVQNFDYLL